MESLGIPKKDDFTMAFLTSDGLETREISTIEEKDVYISLIKQNVSEIKWGEYFSTELLVFKDIWLALLNNIVTEKTRSCIWEQIHLNFFTTYWFNKISDDEKVFSLCKIKPNSMRHLMLDCALVKKLWHDVKEKIRHYVPEDNRNW